MTTKYLTSEQKNPFWLEQDSLANIFNPSANISLPPIVGGVLNIENTLTYNIETTVGTFPISKWEDLVEVLKKGIRILIVVKRTNDLVTLIKHLGPEACYYAHLSPDVKYGPPFHEGVLNITNIVLKWTPCSCHHDTCFHKGLRSGWIEVVNAPYEVITSSIIRSPAEFLPDILEIERVFKDLDETLQKEGIGVRFFSRPGRVGGEILQSKLPESLLNYNTNSTNFPLWDLAAQFAAEASSLGVQRLRRGGITSKAVHDDRRSAHMADLKTVPIITPRTAEPLLFEGNEEPEKFKTLVKNCLEVMAFGIRWQEVGEPPQYKLKASNSTSVGIIPTLIPVLGCVTKDNILDCYDFGGDFHNIKAIFFMKRNNKEPIETYAPLVNWIFNLGKKCSYIKWVSKAVVGKMGNYYWKYEIPLLKETSNNTSSMYEATWRTWRPKDPLPSTSYGVEGIMNLPACQHLIVRASVLSKVESKIRREIAARGSNVDMGANMDGLTSIQVGGYGRKNGLGDFRRKTNPGERVAQIYDNIVAYESDNHRIDYIEISDESDGKATHLEGNTVEWRNGLEVFSSSVPEIAWVLLGQIKSRKVRVPIGSRKLIGPTLSNGDLQEGISSIFRFASTKEDVNYLISIKDEGDYDGN